MRTETAEKRGMNRYWWSKLVLNEVELLHCAGWDYVMSALWLSIGTLSVWTHIASKGPIVDSESVWAHCAKAMRKNKSDCVGNDAGAAEQTCSLRSRSPVAEKLVASCH